MLQNSNCLKSSGRYISSIERGKCQVYSDSAKTHLKAEYKYGSDLKYKCYALKSNDQQLEKFRRTHSLICPICFDSLMSPCETPCGHFFCKSCIIAVLLSENKTCPYCRTPINAYVLKIVESGEFLLKRANKIEGSVYIQGGTLGLASYHFDSVPDNCYISYESDRCKFWPSLANGERPPEKKYFINCELNEEARTFRGDIEWHPTDWQGDALWRYEMYFSEDYEFISGGQVVAYDAVENGNVKETHTFGINLHYKRYAENNLLLM